MVEQVEDFRAKLQLVLAESRNVLERGKIRVDNAGAEQRVAACGSIRVGRVERDLGKCARVEVPLCGGRLPRCRGSTGYAIWLGRSVKVPSRFVSTPEVTVNGVPVLRVVMPFSCQLPSSCEPAPSRWICGVAHRYEAAKRCGVLKSNGPRSALMLF